MPSDLQPTALIDSREQRPLPIRAYPTEIVTLPVGDYGIKGFSDWENPQFICERKSLDDLVQSLTHGRARFEREILKMRQFAFRALLIEAEQVLVEIGDYRSAATPQALLQSLVSFQVRHNLHIVWCGSHEGAARVLERLIRQFARGVHKAAKRLERAGAGVEG